ncbi:MAG: hypothetical protein JXR83_00230 [Deltaproteobacteria bacterium]|nr:hypothetical protein [Deltaproteobacteria bacterium]
MKMRWAIVGLMFGAMMIGRTALASDTVAQQPTAVADEQQPAESGQELGVMEHYFPFGLSENANQEIKDIFILTLVLNLLPAGGLWGPLLLLKNPPKIESDVIVSYLVPAAVGYVTSCFIIGIPIYLYIAPVAALNAYDRAIKAGGAAPEASPQNYVPVTPVRAQPVAVQFAY